MSGVTAMGTLLAPDNVGRPADRQTGILTSVTGLWTTNWDRQMERSTTNRLMRINPHWIKDQYALMAGRWQKMQTVRSETV